VGQGYDFKQMVTVFKKFFATERKAPGVVSESDTIIPNKWIIDTSIQKWDKMACSTVKRLPILKRIKGFH